MYFLYVLQYNLFFLILSLYYNFKIYFIKRLNKKNLKTENEKKKKKDGEHPLFISKAIPTQFFTSFSCVIKLVHKFI